MQSQDSLVKSAPLPGGVSPFASHKEESKSPFGDMPRPRQTIRIQQNDNLASLVMKSPVLSKMFSIQKTDGRKEITLFEDLKTSYNQKRELSISQQGSHRSIQEESRTSVMREFRCSKSNARMQKIVSCRPLASRENNRTEGQVSGIPLASKSAKLHDLSELQFKPAATCGLKESLASVSTDSSQAKLGQSLPFKMRSKSIDNSNSMVASNLGNTGQQNAIPEPSFKVSSNLGMTDLLKTVSQNRDFIIKKQHLPGAGSFISPIISAESSPCNNGDTFKLPSQQDNVKAPSSFAEMFARKTQTEPSYKMGFSAPGNKSRDESETKPAAFGQPVSQTTPIEAASPVVPPRPQPQFRHDIVSVKGVTPGKVKTNQDYAGYFKFLTKCGREVRLYSLADGHGPFGDCASRLAVQMLTNQVQLSLADFEASDASADTKTTICEVIRLSFVRVQKALKSDKHTRFRLSGTTMILALVFQNTLFLANLGDSRVIVGSAKDPKASWPSPCVCSFETKMHKPEDKDEKERIYSCGGLVEPYVDEVTGESSGPARVWNRQRMAPGLAISRTLGDTIAHSVGVCSDPGRPYS